MPIFITNAKLKYIFPLQTTFKLVDCSTCYTVYRASHCMLTKMPANYKMLTKIPWNTKYHFEFVILNTESKILIPPNTTIYHIAQNFEVFDGFWFRPSKFPYQKFHLQKNIF